VSTHFRGPELLITDEMIAVRVPQWRQLRICKLRDPQVVILRTWWPIGPRVYELHAWYGDHLICLYSTRDGARFGQVRRALVRSFETERERHERYGVSAAIPSPM